MRCLRKCMSCMFLTCCCVCCCLQVPPTMRFIMDGEMPEYLLAKDLILQVGGVM